MTAQNFVFTHQAYWKLKGWELSTETAQQWESGGLETLSLLRSGCREQRHIILPLNKSGPAQSRLDLSALPVLLGDLSKRSIRHFYLLPALAISFLLTFASYHSNYFSPLGVFLTGAPAECAIPALQLVSLTPSVPLVMIPAPPPAPPQPLWSH